MTQKEVVAGPDLQHLRYKIETNELGQIAVNPPPSFFIKPMRVRSLTCSAPCGRGARLNRNARCRSLEAPRLPTGLSCARFRPFPRRVALTIAPEICVEVVSPSNTAAEPLAKRDLYSAAGAMEFWTCDEVGGMTFFNPSGALEHSTLCPEFPLTVEND